MVLYFSFKETLKKSPSTKENRFNKFSEPIIFLATLIAAGRSISVALAFLSLRNIATQKEPGPPPKSAKFPTGCLVTASIRGFA